MARKPTVHYIGFVGDEFTRAYRLFGGPAMIHRVYDRRAKAEIDKDVDTVIFANKESPDKLRVFSPPDVTGPGWDRE